MGRRRGEAAHEPHVRAAHEQFVTTGSVSGSEVRRAVVESWARSRSRGVDPEQLGSPTMLAHADLDALRREHPLAVAVPAIRHLLVQPSDGWVTALTDDTGRLLWVEGDPSVRREVERVGFVEGARWSEDHAGTNAPGMALALDSEARVLGAEHWVRTVQQFNCVAAPVHGPSGRVLGVVDVTGGPVVASGMARALVRATVSAVESIIASDQAGRHGAVEAHDAPWLRVLGPRPPLLRLPEAEVQLTGRHSEVLLLLAEHPDGFGAEELACLLSADDLSGVSVRAEISRLRRAVGPLLSESRPYRLTRQVHTDVAAVRAALEIGDVGLALAGYPGPVLPRSVAPAVERIRSELATDLWSAVLASRDADVLRRWTSSPEGADDWQAWRVLAQVTATGSAEHLRAVARLADLERVLRRR
jgi:hypothetical protein